MNYEEIKTFEDACEERSVDPALLPDVSMLPVNHQKSITAYYKLVIIAEALNDGWQPDYNNVDTNQYFPYFGVETDKKRPSGFGFSGTDYGRWTARTTVGSRLEFKSREIALYAGKQFQDLYKDYLLLT